MSCYRHDIRAHLSWPSYPCSAALAVLSGYPVMVFLSWLFSHGCPVMAVLAFCPRGPVHWLSCHGGLVRDALSQATLSRLSSCICCPAAHVPVCPHMLSFSCPGCPVSNEIHSPRHPVVSSLQKFSFYTWANVKYKAINLSFSCKFADMKYFLKVTFEYGKW